MNDELNAFSRGDANFEHAAGGVSADEHVEVVEIEHSDRVSVGVQHVVIGDPVLACTRHDHGIHEINLP